MNNTRKKKKVCLYDRSKLIWPTNFGCVQGTNEKIITLTKNQKIDRFGSDFGYYFGKKSSFDSRSIPYVKPNRKCAKIYNNRINNNRLSKNRILYKKYKIEKDFKVKICHSAPAFEHLGGAVQYRLYEGSLPLNNNADITAKNDISDASGKLLAPIKVPNVAEMIKYGYLSFIPDEKNKDIPKFK
jgi:hypothetical protein